MAFMSKGQLEIVEGNEIGRDPANLKKDAQAQYIIVQTVDKELLGQLFECKTTNQIYKKLEGMYERSEDRDKTQRKENFFNFKQNSEVDMPDKRVNLDNQIYRIKQL